MRDLIYPSLAPDELAAAGQALFGAAWRAELARVLHVSEAEIARVENGRVIAPAHWRSALVALAQDLALRALDTASNLLWRVSSVQGETPEPVGPLAEPIYA